MRFTKKQKRLFAGIGLLALIMLMYKQPSSVLKTSDSGRGPGSAPGGTGLGSGGPAPPIEQIALPGHGSLGTSPIGSGLDHGLF